MVEPNFKHFFALARDSNFVPVYESITADLLTPVAAFLKLARKEKYACLLESVEGGENIGRYTFLGIEPAEIFRSKGRVCILETKGERRVFDSDPIVALRERVARYKPLRIAGLPPLTGGAIGYFAYEMVRLLERIPAHAPDELNLDDSILMFFHGIVAFDHVRHRVWIVQNVFTEDRGNLKRSYQEAVRKIRHIRRQLEQPLPKIAAMNRQPPPRFTSNFTKAQYVAAVKKAKEYIRAGDIFQVVPSQRFSACSKIDAFEIYRSLRVVNPSPYLYYLRLGDIALVGSSPEMLVKVQGRDAFYRPIAGTRPRGRTQQDDKSLEKALLADPKERAEHIMLVDLGRNDLGRVCEYGSVRVERLMFVERYSHVMHLVSTLRGRLRKNADCLDAIMACFPAGTLSGAPKIRAMEIIDELEPSRRGIYGGAILYLDFSGNLDSCIALRTLIAKDGVFHVQAGGGVVADSVPEKEYQETVNKARALFVAVEMAHQRKRE